MTKSKYPLLALLLLLGLFYSCEDSGVDPEQDSTAETNVEESDDYAFDTDITYIVLDGTAVYVTGSGATAEGTVATITTAGTYSVSGSLTNGQLIIDAAATDKVKVMLNGANIANSSNAPLWVKSAAKVVLYLAPETENSLTDGSANSREGALYSATKLSLFGTGALSVTANADGGMVSAGGMIIKEGVYTVSAAGSAIKSDKNLVIDGGTFTLAAGNDGIHGEESLTFNGGDILISRSEEGVESAEITINSGTRIQLTATDDGLNASSGDDSSENHFYMRGGYLYINAAGDGIDANGYIEMTGGIVVVDGPTASGNGAIDYDKTFTISGGLLVAVGSSGMAQAPSQSSTQNVVKVSFGSAKQAGHLVHVQDSNGNGLLTFSPAKSYQSLLFSSPSLSTGSAYQLYLGGGASGTATNGLFEDAAYTAGTLSNSFTISGSVTTLNAN
ncbi:carbohydrate-binding domain-containing protein [Cesiribacter sp. SM1]|uniref:carbohydrate-binding domain-containing protein n=1 Tax=Cesiribacter sp. SM1 TaxID=2861196 RepID=UPI001CD54841|nr:carbohydrate-binding domain-containing protein [Cesiribacter sp. SM1]